MRRIFVPLNGIEDAGLLLQLAGHLAAPFGAEIQAGLVTDIAAQEEVGSGSGGEASAAAHHVFEEWAAGRDPAIKRVGWQEIAGGAVYAAASFGRACDLIVTRGHLAHGARAFRDAVLASGRLTLLVPAHPTRFDRILDRVVLAWDGSAGATRALGLSLSLLEEAASVRIVVIGRNTVGIEAREALESYIALYSKDAKLLVLEHGHRQTGRALLDVLRGEEASMVVMGMCGRSHPAGFAGGLGGTILKVIDNNRLPILTVS